jgi:leucyl aminopeptidase
MPQLSWSTTLPAVHAGSLLAIPVAADDPGSAARLDAFLGPNGSAAATAARFKGAVGETFAATRATADGLVQLLLVGIGPSFADADAARRAAYTVTRRASELGCAEAVLDLRGLNATILARGPAELATLFAYGAQLGTYVYEPYLPQERRLRGRCERVIFTADTEAPAQAVSRGSIVAAATMRARDLVNGPAQTVTPEFLATTAQQIAAEHAGRGVDTSATILDVEACRARGMGCFLAVGQGSDQPPRFIHLAYRPRQPSRGRAVLVGKGVTFDSGGYSLKPTDGMLDMKMDMAGAAAVICAFDALAHLEVPYEIHALVAAAENMVSGRAYRLGDILLASDGKTVEINNTDAEGRLTLADALIYGGTLEPDIMIDLATLTGACAVALGPRIAGVMTRDERLADGWLAAAARWGEAMWRLPLPADLMDQLKSPVAHMKNTGERYGGALTAGLFLAEFVQGRRWMHVDIAGPAMASKPWGVTREGGTGFGVATLVELFAGDALP